MVVIFKHIRKAFKNMKNEFYALRGWDVNTWVQLPASFQRPGV